MKKFFRSFRSALMLLILVAHVLIGCGGGVMYWYHPSKDIQSVKNDKYECESAAARYSADMGKAGKEDIVNKRFKECMELKGYIYTEESSIPKGASKIE
ncbi:MAG: hypothetical protein KBE27_06430 [Syntrophorhabdaceae bacterium]|jgi:hypothetical protein|nr:hypothetical protein [Syntrophorhabdales bacterium]MBP9561435.1 hypothetical protein [Syntrophorhabdaceae bacterium]